MSLKLLINGVPGAGKTELLRTLGKETFVVSRDAKNFNLPLPHMLAEKWYNMDIFLYGGKVRIEDEDVQVDGVYQKLMTYLEKFGQPPENVVFDSVSQIWMDIIEESVKRPNVYGSQSAEQTAELGKLTKFIHEELELNGVNVILINHVTEEKEDGKLTGNYVPFGQGKFLSKGGFYSTVNEAITLVPEGQHRAVYMRGNNKQSRTLLQDVPDKLWLENHVQPEKSRKLKDGEYYFQLRDHLDKLAANQTAVDDFRL